MRPRLAILVLAALLVCRCRGHRHPETLVVAMDQDVLTIDPHQHDDSVTHSVLSNVYEGLVTFDPEMRIVPALAASWSNPTDLVWRFRLRDGVRFHDGRPVTAAAVKASLERARRMKSAHYLVAISRIDVLDDRTFDLHTDVAQPMLLNKLAVVAIVPEGTAETMPAAVGTGAYRVLERTPGKTLSLAANESYWGGSVAIRRAEYRVLPSPDQRALALLRGEIHLAREVPRRLLGGPGTGVRFVSHAGLAVVFLGTSFRVPSPLLKKEVRQAIYWALDPAELIARSGVEGAPAEQIVPASVFGFLPSRPEARPQLARARELLAAAGYPTGFEITLEAPRSAAEAIGPALADQLRRAGIRASVVGLDWSELAAKLERQESPFYSVGWACYGDASDIFDAMLHTRDGKSYGASNFGGYSNPEMDRAIERAGAILQPDRRLEALHAAMRIALEELPIIPMYNRKRTYGVSELVRFHPRQNGQVLLREISWTDGPTSSRSAGKTP